jgi:hypothetical protein
MGAKGRNFHLDVFARMGWESACETIQSLYLAGDKKGPIAAVPTAMVEDVDLIGPVPKVLDELEQWRTTCLTTVLIQGPPAVLEKAAEVIGHGESQRL